MGKKHFITSLVVMFVLSFSTNFIQSAHAISIDFESPVGSGYDLFNGAALTTAQSHSPTQSAILNDPVNDSLVKIVPSGLNLGTTSGSFWSYIPQSSNVNLAPYMIFGVDVNNDGSWDGGINDALVIAFITGAGAYPADTWFQSGLDAGTKVHVVGGRPGLAAGTFSSSGTQDTLAALSAMSTGGGLWGDLPLLRIYVEIGEWPLIDSYTAYVDDIQVNAVHEPSTMLLLGSGLFGLAGYGRKKFFNK